MYSEEFADRVLRFRFLRRELILQRFPQVTGTRSNIPARREPGPMLYKALLAEVWMLDEIEGAYAFFIPT